MQTARKLEIDITKPDQLIEVAGLCKVGCLSITVPPSMVTAAVLCRGYSPPGTLNRRFKIIAQIDWPRGDHNGPGLDKFRGVDLDAIRSVDGYEIMLSSGDRRSIAKEVNSLYTYKNQFFNNIIEFRFVLGYHNQGRDNEYFENVLDVLKSHPAPSAIRATHLNKIPATKATIGAQNGILDFIRSKSVAKIKISGNINSKIVANCKADFFGVTLQQAQSIIRDMKEMKGITK